MPALKIYQNFDRAAGQYHAQASLQEQVALQLVADAKVFLQQPRSLLDIGCGTGFVAEALRKQWPEAALTAVDQSSNMLRQTERRVAQVLTIRADAFTIEFTQKFDAIFSSMMLHWLPDPLEALQRWQSWLKPGGKMFVALLVEGSFQEWRDLCRIHNVEDGLWPMPKADFAGGLTSQHQQAITIAYPSARAFLQRLKTTGTATPRPDHTPFNIASMRQLLKNAAQPFPVTYQVLSISLQGKS